MEQFIGECEMNAFVGYKPKPLAVDDLLELISRLKTANTYFFYRRSDSVSGIISEAPTNEQFPMVEGQIFNHQFELRWKHKRQNSYEVLFLGNVDHHPDFTALENDWLIEERNAHLYPPTETRFPKGFDYPALDIKQRYFLDQKTANVHFVALTVDR